MSFRTNLQYLRAQRNMTQEQLAMLLGVSRQAISKWESEKAYPEMDKLLMVCDLFGCTLDDLVLGDVSHPTIITPIDGGGGQPQEHPGEHGSEVAAGSGSEVMAGSAAGVAVGFRERGGAETGGRVPAALAGLSVTADGSSTASAGSLAGSSAESSASSAGSTPGTGQSKPTPAGASAASSVLAQDLTGYDEHMKTFAGMISMGVAVIIAGVALGMLFDEENSIIGVNPMNGFVQFLCIVAGVLIGLMGLIPGGMAHTQFKRRHPYVENFYTEEDWSRASRRLAIALVSGLALIFIGVAQSIYADEVLGVDDGWPISIMLAMVALAVFLFTYFGIRHSMLNLDAYNKEVEEEHGKPDFYGKLTGAVCGIIMIIATIIGLCFLFSGYAGGQGGWRNAPLFWLAWPIGGLLCAVASIIIQILKDGHRR
jgi:transcriptional regulator with XRE-family HTH domain/succinate dehydrogenase/fumarate reductase cytochrome b subunit